jgi:hypothetical protein
MVAAVADSWQCSKLNDRYGTPAGKIVDTELTASIFWADANSGRFSTTTSN